MIRIYAFCGMGKTTLCDKYGYVDDDMYYPQRPVIKQEDVVLTNELSDECDAYFLPPSYNVAFHRLALEKQKFFNEYDDLLKKEYETVKKKYNPIIKDYITQKDIINVMKKEV